MKVNYNRARWIFAVTTNTCLKYVPCMCFKTDFLYYFNERNLPFTIRKEKTIHTNNEVKIMLILPAASMEMLAIRIT